MLEKKKRALEDKYHRYIINVISINFILMIVLLFVSIYISKLLQKKFDKYKHDIKEKLTENARQQEVLTHQSKMAAMGEMIGNIAHQWRQPLSVITTAASGVKLNKELTILTDENLEESMDLITLQANYLSKTIEDFRSFLKVNQEKTEFDIAEAVDSAISLTNAQFKNKYIQVVSDIKPITVYGIKNQFIQVIINIFNNAKDELIKQEEHQRVILVNNKIEDKKVILTIQDSAGGIPVDILNRVFEPYFSTKEQTDGTGIGLYMSQEIVEKVMNGKIIASNDSFEFKDNSYYGAVFSIEIPIN